MPKIISHLLPNFKEVKQEKRHKYCSPCEVSTKNVDCAKMSSKISLNQEEHGAKSKGEFGIRGSIHEHDCVPEISQLGILQEMGGKMSTCWLQSINVKSGNPVHIALTTVALGFIQACARKAGMFNREVKPPPSVIWSCS